MLSSSSDSTTDAQCVAQCAAKALLERDTASQRGERIALFRGRSHRINGQVTTE
jgi:hypothetical protein